MKAFLKLYGKTLAIIIAVGVGFALVVSAMFMLSRYENQITDRAEAKSQYQSILVKETVLDGIQELINSTETIAQECSHYTDETLFLDYLTQKKSYRGRYGVEQEFNQVYDILDINFYHDGDIRQYNGADKQIDSNPAVELYTNNCDHACYAGIFFDSDETQKLISFYCPVTGSDFCEAISVVYTRRRLELFFPVEYRSELAEYTLLVDYTGSIIIGDDSKSATLKADDSVVVGNVIETLEKSTGSKTAVTGITNLLTKKIDGTSRINIVNSEYVVSVICDETDLPDLAIVELYSVRALCSTGLEFVYSIIAIFILFVIIAIGVIIYLISRGFKMKKKLFNIEVVDPLLGCYNRRGFEDHMNKILDRNVNTYFAVIEMEIKHFGYIIEKVGIEESRNVLRYVKYTLDKFCIEEEIYAYNDDGRFFILNHAKDKDDLVNRLKSYAYICSKYKGQNRIDINLKFGIYEIYEDEKTSVSKMIDFAIEANKAVQKSTADNALMQFNFYDNELRKHRRKNEDMELRMESALRDGEFQVFFQPKYNLTTDRQDGCEALVRWYDVATGIYNPPALFMALFEENGFITKLDRYVFERVCEYISYSIAHGRTVYPVSINVSRITAIQPGFAEYYSKIKKKYGVSDNLLMVEFTESFAYENYDILSKIVNELHQSGFKCSIDDFGCGYSSYLILKSLPMDEIKLDKIFMEKGFDDERDKVIYQSIVKLGKDLKMKVTQEGVETKEGTDYIRSMGCDVLQGYIYSKPLSMSDYIKFTQSSREHNLKK